MTRAAQASFFERFSSRSYVKRAKERSIHIMVADDLARFCKRGWIWTHIPLGEKRSPETARLLSRMGVRPGWPDFIFISPQGVLHFLELKSASGKLTPEQQDFFIAMAERGIEYQIARSYDEAIRILHQWGVVPVTVSETAE